MTTVMKIQFNTRADANSNISTSFEHIVSNTEEARELGVEDKGLLDAYVEGFTSDASD